MLKAKNNFFSSLISPFFALIFAMAFILGCGGSDSDSSNTDSEGNVLSSTKTGIALPAQVQTVPAENSSARSLTRSDYTDDGFHIKVSIEALKI
jgi:hypothetical protein